MKLRVNNERMGGSVFLSVPARPWKWIARVGWNQNRVGFGSKGPGFWGMAGAEGWHFCRGPLYLAIYRAYTNT